MTKISLRVMLLLAVSSVLCILAVALFSRNYVHKELAMKLMAANSEPIKIERQSNVCLFFWYRGGRGVAAFGTDPLNDVIASSEAWIAQGTGKKNRPYCTKRILEGAGTNGIVYEEFDGIAPAAYSITYVITLNSGYILIVYSFEEKESDAQGISDIDNFVKGLQVVEE